MNQLVLTTRRRTYHIRLGRPLLLAGLAFIISVTSASFYLGSQLGPEKKDVVVTLDTAQGNIMLSQELSEQQELVETARDDAQKYLDSMAARLSTLQGHVMRLNALGSRLARMAELEEIDFSVNQTPGMGGPEPAGIQRSLSVPDFITELDQLSSQIADRNDKLIAIESMLMDRHLQSETVPDGSPIEDGWISSHYGWRTDPITGKRNMHMGTDFAARYGTEIKSVAAGIVTWSAWTAGYGNVVEIDHGNNIVTRYAHNKENLVTVGEKVEKGTVIATLGSTGRSTGSHLHFEMLKDGKYVNPRKHLTSLQ